MLQFYKKLTESCIAMCLLMLSFNDASAQTYCIPTYTTGCAVGDNINNVILVGDVAPGINNLNTPCATTAYTDYTTMSATLTAGFTYNGNVTTGYAYPDENVRIWIDYNNDGIFQATEQIGTLTNISSASTGVFTFTVPIVQAAGTYRMRVRLVYYTAPSAIDPCTSETYGEAQDYKVTIIASTPCTGTPVAGTLPATLGVCASIPFSISAIGSTLAGNMANQWQSRNPAGTGVWTNITGATVANYASAGITTATDYRYITKCITSGLSDTTTVLAVTINPAYQCYCTPSTPAGGDDYINSFTTTGATQNISNLLTGFTSPGYANYSGTDTLIVYQGTTVNFNTEIGTLYDQFGERIWIDYGMDGSFNNTNEKVFESGGNTLNPPITGSFTIPLTATPGVTRMRVRIESYDFPDPCAPLPTYDYGEAEDYAIKILQLPVCSTVTQPVNITIDANHDTVCVVQDVIFTLQTALPPSTGITFQYQSAPNATGPWTNIGTPQATSTLTAPNVSVATYYRLQVLCSGSVVSGTTSNILHVIITNPQVLSVQDSFHCGPGPVNLAAVGATNTSLKWYANASGGLAVGSGNNYTTPYILQTDTFYVTSGVGGGAVPPTFIGTGTSTTTSNPSPYYNLYDGNRTQYLIKASELQAAGFSAGTITGIGFDVLGAGSLPLLDFTVKLGSTSLNTLATGAWAAGLTQVYTTPSLTTTANTVNAYTFTTPFPWDGVSNIIVQTCYYNGNYGFSDATVKYTTGLSFNATHYSNQDANTTICSDLADAGFSYGVLTSRPNIRFSMVTGCESPRHPVIAYIRPVPQVNLGNDFNVCVDAGANFTLDAGTYPNSPTYLWDNNSTSQTRGVNTSGSYKVAVTNSYGCTGRDTVNVTLRNNPVVNLGVDTTVCEGIILTLNAGNDGISYFWSTGENSNTINVDHSGTYTVIVTNTVGCTKTDTIKVTMSGHIPTTDGINVNNTGPMTFKFNAMNPLNVVNYDWDFGDGSAHSPMINPSHTYHNANNYLVKLKILGTCGKVLDSSYVHILGIGNVQMNKTELYIYPNPTTGKVNIVNKGNLKMERIEIFNILGQKIYSEKSNTPKEHEILLQGIASGIYTVQILTDEGTVTQKLEIVQ